MKQSCFTGALCAEQVADKSIFPASQPIVGQEGQTCLACNAPTLASTAFCGDCGAKILRACPACNVEVGNSEFCEACGLWLLPGQCRFCYATLSAGVAFCEECGCDQSGLLCPDCKTRCFFDFCSGCGTVLSEAGENLLATQAIDPSVQELLSDLNNESVEAYQVSPTSTSAPSASVSMPSVPQKRTKRQLISAGSLETMKRLTNSLDLAEAKRQQERDDAYAAETKRKRKRVKAYAADTANKTFTDAQQARCYFMGFLQLMNDAGVPPRAWLCNFATCQHTTPNECGKPELGGVWLFDDIND